MDRRRVLTCMLGASALGASRIALAQPFPSRPIRIVGGFGPGSTTDIVARLTAPRMQSVLGQTLVIDNVTGAAGNLASTTVAHASPDGYTLLFATNSMLGANPHLFPTAKVDPMTALEPVALATNVGIVIVAGPASPSQKSLLEVLDAARRKPGTVSYATPGVGTPMHLIAEILKQRSGADLLHVPYAGGPAVANDVLSGQVSIGILAYTPAAGFIKAGRLKALAVCGTQRLAALPQVPTVAELVPGVTMGSWCGLMAPHGTPGEACARVADALGKALADPEVTRKLVDIGADPLQGGSQAMAGLIKSDYDTSGEVIRRLDIRVS